MKKLKNQFYSFSCKNCEDKFQTYSVLKMKHHLQKTHNKNLTAKDYRFAMKHHIVTQIIKTILFIPILLLIMCLKTILYLPHELYEFLDNL